jgi:SNF2 family DNA or RNA helicase
MEEIVEDAIANNNKVVIFSNWSQIVDIAYDRLYDKQYGIMRITGDTADSQRQSIVDTFQNTDMCRVLIGTIGAMGTGLTLTVASTIILLDEPWNMALREQAVDRCHRIGQNNNVTIYTIMCQNTIDTKIHKLVYEKGEMSDRIVDSSTGNILNKRELVNYLLE